jgi:MinD superfamily P-loop ATPase
VGSINFIGGEKGGVGKSVVSRVLAQYHIDGNKPFIGFDTDRSHSSFLRFYGGYAHPTVVDSYESMDAIANAVEQNPHQNVIVDLAAQTFAPVSRWIADSNFFEALKEINIAVNFWHVMDDGKDSVELLGRLFDAFGKTPKYVIVLNYGRGTDFSIFNRSAERQRAAADGVPIIEFPKLHDACMRKIDQQNTSFWAAVNNRSAGEDTLGLLERQRVKTWLRSAYEALLPVALD